MEAPHFDDRIDKRSRAIEFEAARPPRDTANAEIVLRRPEPTLAEDVISIDPEQVCFIINKAREFDAKVEPDEPDRAPNPRTTATCALQCRMIEASPPLPYVRIARLELRDLLALHVHG